MLHRTLPVHNAMKGCLLKDDGTVFKYLNADSWEDEVTDGSLGQVMVEIPEFYIKYTTNAGITICKGMTLENLLEIKNQYNLNEMKFDILNDYYVKKHKLDKIAITYSYSVDNIKKIKSHKKELV